MAVKVLWSWTDPWTADDVGSVSLPKLLLVNLEGKTTLFLSGEFTLYCPKRLAPEAAAVLGSMWDTSSSESAVIERAHVDASQATETFHYSSVDDLIASVAELSARDENYVVRLEPFAVAEQDGTIFVIEADGPWLRKLFARLNTEAAQAGWVFMDVLDDD